MRPWAFTLVKLRALLSGKRGRISSSKSLEEVGGGCRLDTLPGERLQPPFRQENCRELRVERLSVTLQLNPQRLADFRGSQPLPVLHAVPATSAVSAT
jgi:hypothetical protein